MELYEKIPLPNGLSVEIWDYSRQIAADATKVELVARIDVEFKESYFPHREHYDKLVRTVGLRGIYEYRKTRAFVRNAEKDTVFQKFLASFREGLLPYLGREDFPRKFAHSRYRDLEEHWYKYNPPETEG